MLSHHSRLRKVCTGDRVPAGSSGRGRITRLLLGVRMVVEVQVLSHVTHLTALRDGRQLVVA
jgi:hypothetical protein